MADTLLRVEIEFCRYDPPQGALIVRRAASPSGQEVESTTFEGWIGLLASLEQLTAGAGTR